MTIADLVPGCTPTTDRLARFVAETSAGDLPPATLERAKRSILDTLGIGLLGSRSESASAYRDYVAGHGSAPQCTVLGTATRYGAYDAALLNATFAHATELFESFTRAMVHPGNVVIPAVLAIAERDRIPGRAVLTAIAVGFELLARVGLSVGNPLLLEQGFHTPGALGGFGAAAGCANLVGLDAAGAADVLGIAACYVPSALNAAMRGATIKELFEGTAAGSGVQAVDLVTAGISGVRDWDEHWYRAIPRNADRAQLVAGLGTEWRIESGGLHYKQRAVMAVGQPVLEACEQLIRGHDIDPAKIARIRLRGGRRILIGGSRRPQTMLAAITSAPFLAAFALVHQAEFLADPHFVRCLTPDRFADSRVLELADGADLEADPQIDHDFEVATPQRFAARVTVEMAGGETYERYVDIWPATSGMSYDELAVKFRRVVSGLVSDSAAEEIVWLVARLDVLEDVSPILRRLAPA
jgi:2-methylcitrate dehydratase PrpD